MQLTLTLTQWYFATWLSTMAVLAIVAAIQCRKDKK